MGSFGIGEYLVFFVLPLVAPALAVGWYLKSRKEVS